MDTDKGWIQGVTTSSVWEGPPGTLGSDKTPEEMAKVILKSNPRKKKGSILRYMQFVINRAGRRMNEDHKSRIQAAMQIVRESAHKE
jgi:hypothetical protein